jgi:hypothetical protein
MRTTHRAVAVLLLALALSGCAQGTGQPSGAGGFASLGPNGSAGPSGSAAPPPAAPPPAANAPTYPTDADTYAKAAVTAWLHGDQARLDQLRDPGNQILHSVGLGDYDKNYTFQDCQGAAGSSYCTFFNAVGDVLVLQLSNPLLGAPHAIVHGTFDPLTFPDDMKAYAQECLDAWRAGNLARVGFLTQPDAKTHLLAVASSHKLDDWTYVDAQGAAGSSYLTWHNPNGDRIVFRFTNPGVDPSEGKQHRIRDVLWNP